MLTRRSVWSDSEVQELVKGFLPVAQDSERAEAESAFFRAFVRRGHFAPGSGAEAPPGVWQGTYVITPGGDLLGSTPSHEAKEVKQLLRDALSKWQAHPESGAGKRPLPASKALAARAAAYPADGLALRVFGRDLVPAKYTGELEPRVGWWNLEFAWFRKAEAAAFVPSPAKVGAEVEVPQPLVARLVRFNLLDTVNGFPHDISVGKPPTYLKGEVELARLVSRVEAVTGTTVELRFEGETRAVTHRYKPERGLATRLTGRATWDSAKGRFTSFELAALGTRWGPVGTGRFDDRAKQPGPSPIGFLFEQGSDAPADRLAPVFLSEYGWR